MALALPVTQPILLTFTLIKASASVRDLVVLCASCSHSPWAWATLDVLITMAAWLATWNLALSMHHFDYVLFFRELDVFLLVQKILSDHALALLAFQFASCCTA